MVDYIVSLVCLVMALLTIELRKTYHHLPVNELRYRSNQGDELARKLYRAVAYSKSLDDLLDITMVLTVAASLILLNRVAPLWLDVLAVILFIWLAFAWLPKVALSSFSQHLTNFLTPALIWILNYTHPVLSKLNNLLPTSGNSSSHTRLYDRKDLFKLLTTQQKQLDNRIPREDIQLTKRVFKLDSKLVGDYAVTWSKLDHLKSHDAVGPVLLDELHKANQLFVPVVTEGEERSVLGLINVEQIDLSKAASLEDLMDRKVNYLHEDDSLRAALSQMSESGYPACVVLDTKERLYGMITLKQVLEELLPAESISPETIPTNEAEKAEETTVSEQIA